MSTVSVIIPTYNRSGLLAEAVSSVLAQTHPVHEIVVVDDGSREADREAARILSASHPVMSLHELPANCGPSRARNEGLARCSGDFVLFLDDDDRLDPSMIESAVKVFMTAAPDVVVCRGELFGTLLSRRRCTFDPFWVDGVSAVPFWLRRWIGVSGPQLRAVRRNPVRTLMTFHPPIDACVVRRDAIGTAHFPEDLRSGEDRLFLTELAVRGCRFAWAPQGRVFVRRHAGNSPVNADTVLAFERLRARVQNQGRDAAFLATARTAHLRWCHGASGSLRTARSLLRSPRLLLRYGAQFVARSVYRGWLATRLSTSVRSRAT